MTVSIGTDVSLKNPEQNGVWAQGLDPSTIILNGL